MTGRAVCVMPLCDREPTQGKKMCWPCWSMRRDLERRAMTCRWDSREAVCRWQGRNLCLAHARALAKLRDRAGPKSFSEIEEGYEARPEPPRGLRLLGDISDAGATG